MNIDVGKFYRTRDGLKAFVAAKRPCDWCGSSFFEFTGWLRLENADTVTMQWNQNGRHNSAGTHPYDLVAEWREPVSKQVEISLLSDGSFVCPGAYGEVYRSPHHVIAKKTITIVEGEGL